MHKRINMQEHEKKINLGILTQCIIHCIMQCGIWESADLYAVWFKVEYFSM